MNATAVYKVLRSRSPRRAARAERLYVIIGTTYDGLPVYTKGAIRKVGAQDVFYFLVSSKRWTPQAD
jgi:hypothetical protein